MAIGIFRHAIRGVHATGRGKGAGKGRGKGHGGWRGKGRGKGRGNGMGCGRGRPCYNKFDKDALNVGFAKK